MSVAKLKVITIMGCLALLLSMLMPTLAKSQQSSSISITRGLFLSFTNPAANFNFDFGNTTASENGGDLFSDTGSTLPDTKILTIEDNRGCGGFNLQMEASTFNPSGANSVSRDFFHIVSSTALTNPPAGSLDNNIYYLSGFNGTQGATTPVNSTCTDFEDAATFTDAACVSSNNTLNGLVDIIQGGLTAPAGRTGEMALGLSFHLEIQPYTIPTEYYSTITYTLTDATTGTC